MSGQVRKDVAPGRDDHMQGKKQEQGTEVRNPRANGGHSTPPSLATVALWLALAAGPVVVLLGQWVAYALVPDACARQSNVFMHLVHLVTLLLLAGAFLTARREWVRLGRAEPDERPGPERRARFMAFSAMLTNPFLALVVLAMWLATLLFSPCSA